MGMIIEFIKANKKRILIVAGSIVGLGLAGIVAFVVRKQLNAEGVGIDEQETEDATEA